MNAKNEANPLAARQVGVKVGLDTQNLPVDDAFIRAWHRLIREQEWGAELPLDVAVYSHVPEGPSVMLICHDGHYALDRRKGNTGLYYVRRARREHAAEDFSASLTTSLTRLANMQQLLLKAPELDGLKFDDSSLSVFSHDRLRTQNKQPVFAALQPAIETVLSSKNLSASFAAFEEREREPFWVDLELKGRIDAFLASA